MLNMKKPNKFLAVIFFLGVLLISEPSYSSNASAAQQLFDDLGNSMSVLVQEFPLYSTIFPGSMGAFLCDIRCMFKGPLGAVIVATAIFIMGVTVLIGKFKWPSLVLITFCIIIFTSAEVITEAIANSSFLGSVNNGNTQIMSFFPQMCQCLGNLLMNEINDPPSDPCVVPPGQPNPC